jgi:TolA-binding protein
MKAQERHQLKQNEFANTVARVSDVVNQNRNLVTAGIAAVLIVAIGLGGFFWYRSHVNDQAGALLGKAMVIVQAQIAPPPTIPGAKQTPGTYPTDKARQEAAVQAFQEVIKAYPNSMAANAARYHSAVALMQLGRFSDAEKAFQDAIDHAGSSIYGPMSRMGLGEAYVAEKQFDKAIALYTDLSGQRDGPLPIDGVLMVLGRTYAKAGKTNEARATFKRVVDEFPESMYANDARTEMGS